MYKNTFISLGRFFVVFCVVFITACTQKPASIINKTTNNTYNSQKYSSKANPFKVRVEQGDTLYGISKKYGVGIRELIELNKLRPPYILARQQVVRLPQATFHMIEKGDTLYAVSRSYDVDIGRIIHINNIQYPYIITPGTKLRLPSSTSYDVATPPPPHWTRRKKLHYLTHSQL